MIAVTMQAKNNFWKTATQLGYDNYRLVREKISRLAEHLHAKLNQFYQYRFQRKTNQISSQFTLQTHKIQLVTFAGKLNHISSLLYRELT